jgi:DNA-binding transcriptional LysR family regulator
VRLREGHGPTPQAQNPVLSVQFIPEIIRLVVMMYVKFPLSLRNVEDLLHERGIDLCHETVRLALSATSQHFIAQGVRPEFSYRSADDDKVLAMVRSGLGITVMPNCYQSVGVARVTLTGFTLRRQIGLIYGNERGLTRARQSSIINSVRRLGAHMATSRSA